MGGFLLDGVNIYIYYINSSVDKELSLIHNYAQN